MNGNYLDGEYRFWGERKVIVLGVNIYGRKK